MFDFLYGLSQTRSLLRVFNMINQSPPESICIIRLSAIGDTCHALAVIRSIQDAWPDTKITWIIGKIEALLLANIPDIEFIIFDKSAGVSEYRRMRAVLTSRRFDVLLHMQVAFRANLVSALVCADRRIGYDRARSKDLHGLFINERIAAGQQQHVQDALQSFITPLGVKAGVRRWDLPLAAADHSFADEHVDGQRPTLCISPVSSHKLRNWNIEGYARVADYAARTHGMQIIITGGPNGFEREFNAAVESHMQTAALNLTGKDTLKRLAALLGRCELLLAPDTGPMHIANAMGTDVLGLHAASNPRRSGPYDSIRWCVDQYDAAAHKYLKRSADDLRWGTKIEHPGVMDLITVDQVTSKLDSWAAQRLNSSGFDQA